MTLLAACSPPLASEPPVDDQSPPCTGEPSSISGWATYYDATDPGNCSFPIGEKLVAAINHTDYRRSEYCGAWLLVTGPDGDVVVRVVDSGPACKQGGLGLSQPAFAV